MKYKKVKVGLIIIAIIFIGLFLISHIPKKFNKSYLLICYDRNNNSSHIQEITLTLEGKYYNPWFFEERIDGTFEIISNYGTIGLDKYETNFSTRLSYDKSYFSSVLVYSEKYYDEENDMFLRRREPIGTLYLTQDMEKIIIQPIREHDSIYNKSTPYYPYIIIGPANTIEKANDIKNLYFPSLELE